MKKVCEQSNPPSKWYKNQIKQTIKNQSLLAAFCFLRDSDVHDQTLSTTPAVRHSVDLAGQTASSEFRLNEKALLTIDTLQKHPWAAEALAAGSVVAVSEAALGELKVVVEQGINDGLF